jgi:hypothetical protein
MLLNLNSSNFKKVKLATGRKTALVSSLFLMRVIIEKRRTLVDGIPDGELPNYIPDDEERPYRPVEEFVKQQKYNLPDGFSENLRDIRQNSSDINNNNYRGDTEQSSSIHGQAELEEKIEEQPTNTREEVGASSSDTVQNTESQTVEVPPLGFFQDLRLRFEAAWQVFWQRPLARQTLLAQQLVPDMVREREDFLIERFVVIVDQRMRIHTRPLQQELLQSNRRVSRLTRHVGRLTRRLESRYSRWTAHISNLSSFVTLGTAGAVGITASAMVNVDELCVQRGFDTSHRLLATRDLLRSGLEQHIQMPTDRPLE